MIPRYKLRTLLVLLAVLPPLLAVGWWKYSAWRAEQDVRAAIAELERQAEADQLVTRITTDLEPIIDEARLIELSSPPKTPMEPMQPQAIDLEKLTRPKAPAKAGEQVYVQPVAAAGEVWRIMNPGEWRPDCVTEAEWLSCCDPEPMVRSLPADRYQQELRLFAVACVRRVWHLLPTGCRAAVEASERFAAGQVGEAELAAAVAVADGEAQVAFPGHLAPDARGYAASAAVDASSKWPRTAANVLAATSCAASAAGCAAGESDEARYDEAAEAARVAELAAQAELLRSFVSVSPE